MARSDGSAYAAASKEAWGIVEGVKESLREAIRDGEVTDEEGLQERMYEEIENALIYISDQWVCAYGLRQSRDPFSEGLLSEPDSIEQVIGIQATLNLEDAIDLSDFADAFAVAEDSEISLREVTL